MKNAGFRLEDGNWVKHYGRLGKVCFKKGTPTPYQLIRDVEYAARQQGIAYVRDALDDLENS